MSIDLDHEKPRHETRVVVAMSGGVDSSVVAALAVEAGYDVVGITLQLYDHGAAIYRKGAVGAGQDIHDARRVAERLAIPHYVLDYESRFRTAVIDRFADSYLAGETPVPCIECNRTIKFRDMLETARDLGADLVATGHYVRSARATGGGRMLRRALDPDRDQSWFLHATTREQLEMLRFPLGDMPKSRTREHARRLGLEVADKADSQDICFVPTGHYAEMIERLRPGAAEAGEIVHLDGRVLGRHPGILGFTVGQRKGLGLSTGEPLYVVALDAVRRRVIIGPREALATRALALREVNWLGDAPLAEEARAGLDIHARVRSTRPPTPARLMAREAGVTVEFLEAEMGVAPGQACVFYDGPDSEARLLGGGTIAGTSAAAAGPTATAA